MSSPRASEAYRKLFSPSLGNGERMVAVRDFSGLVSSPWALANAAAMAPMVSLERCIGYLRIHQVKADGAGFRTLGAQTVAGGFLGILRHHFLKLSLGAFMLLMG